MGEKKDREVVCWVVLCVGRCERDSARREAALAGGTKERPEEKERDSQIRCAESEATVDPL